MLCFSWERLTVVGLTEDHMKDPAEIIIDCRGMLIGTLIKRSSGETSIAVYSSWGNHLMTFNSVT